MYNCDDCKQPSYPGQRMIRKVTEVRTKEYPFRKNANKKGFVPHGPGYEGAEKPKNNDDKGGVGEEIVSEKKLCLKCGDPEAHKAFVEKMNAPKKLERQ